MKKFLIKPEELEGDCKMLEELDQAGEAMGSYNSSNNKNTRGASIKPEEAAGCSEA